jgi:hypothetical protein
MSFRIKLLLAMMLLVVGVTAATLLRAWSDALISARRRW